MNIFRLFIIGVSLPAVVGILGCDDAGSGKAPAADYSACDPAPINNQKLVCNSFKDSVETLCGFSLTAEPCDCVEEVGCTTDVNWLGAVIDCGDSSSNCVNYIACLEALGESETEGGDCDNPTQWDCLVAMP